MYRPGKYEKSAEELLDNVIRIICDEQNRPVGKSEKYFSHSEAHGFEVMVYLWKNGAIVVEKGENQGQMRLKVENGKKTNV